MLRLSSAFSKSTSAAATAAAAAVTSSKNVTAKAYSSTSFLASKTTSSYSSSSSSYSSSYFSRYFTFGRLAAAGTTSSLLLLFANSSYNNNNNNTKMMNFFSFRNNNKNQQDDELVAFCANKAPDTPEYLIPYYLRDTKSRFSHYASIKADREKKTGKKMTPHDFLCAMLALENSEDGGGEGKSIEQATKHFATFFKWADADGDGTINYREFAFLANILAFPIQDWKVLFNLFDREDKGGVSPAQFGDMLTAISDSKMRPKLRSGIVRAMFVPEDFKRFETGAELTTSANHVADKVPRDSVCTFDRFARVVGRIERMISETEFRLYDDGAKGHVTNEEFGKMILNSIHGRHLPYFLVDNLRKSATQGGAVKLETYLLFSEMIRSAEKVAQALQLYAAAGYGIRADDLQRAVNRCVGLSRPMKREEADLFVKMFDANSDGELHIDEFVSILRAKASYAGVLPQEKERENLFLRVARCTAEGIKTSVVGDEEED